ncbi:hypothetical protein ACFL9T_04865 [Thermodesulfobacteriota bacterium]
MKHELVRKFEKTVAFLRGKRKIEDGELEKDQAFDSREFRRAFKELRKSGELTEKPENEI